MMKTNLTSAILACTGILASVAPSQAQPRAPVAFNKAITIEVVAGQNAQIKGGDWDDKAQKIALRVKFINSDSYQSYDGYTATVSAFGQAVLDPTVRRVLMQQQIPLTIPPRKTVEHACEPVTTRFDKTGARFGYFYDGWIVVVKDPSGKVVHIKATSQALESMPEKAVKLVKDACYKRNLDPTSGPSR